MFELPELPELPPCPYHAEPPVPLASCHICWKKFYIPFEYGPLLRSVNRAVEDYINGVEKAKQFVALRQEGFETDARPPKNTKVIFALPNGERISGKNIDDLMGGTYPVRNDEEQTPISSYMGWRPE
jgi:hypothetical protein